MILRELVTRLSLDSKNAEHAAKKFDKTLSDLKNGLKVVTVAVAGAGAALFGLAKSTANQGDAIAKNARDVGFAAGAYQELAFAANLAGINQGELNSNLRLFNDSVRAAARAGNDGDSVFKRLGISVLDASGNIRDSASLFDEASHALGNLSEEERRIAARDLFGRSGARMGVFLSQGTEAIQAQREEARKLGLVLGDDVLDSSEAFQDSLFKLQQVVTGIKNTIGAALIPIILEVSESLKDWFLLNREIIKQRLQDFVGALVATLRALFKFIGFVIDVSSKLAAVLGGWEKTIRLLIVGVSALMALRLARWIYGVATALLSATSLAAGLRAALLRIPFVAIAVGLAFLGEKVWKYAEENETALEASKAAWRDFVAWLESFGGTVKSVLDAFWIGVADAARSAAIGIKNSIMLILQPVLDVIDTIRDAVPSVSKISERASSLRSRFDDGLSRINPFITPQQALANSGGGRAANAISINETINITVPAGTNREQAEFIGNTVRTEIEKTNQRVLRQALEDFPEGE